ncbi:MAG: hypothetical protein QM664_08435 [Flavihumibacter sp.]
MKAPVKKYTSFEQLKADVRVTSDPEAIKKQLAFWRFFSNAREAQNKKHDDTSHQRTGKSL